MEKKSELINTHITKQLRDQFVALAELRGFKDISSFTRFLIEETVEQERSRFAALSKVFDDESKNAKENTRNMGATVSTHTQARLMLH